jgi:TonB family protein
VANQDLRFRRRVVTTVVEPQPKNKLMMMLTVAVAAVIVPAMIYTALHPSTVSSTVSKIAKHLPLPTKDIRIAIVASRSTPTPQPSATPNASPSPKASKAGTAAEQAHLAHLKRAHALALAAAHAKKLASTDQTSDINTAGGTDGAGNTDATPASDSGAATNSTSGLTTSATAAPAAVAAADQAQPVADATPVYAPEMVVEARFTHQAKPDYPDVAKEQNAEGTAVVLATIGPDGHVLSARIDQSTGNKLLDGAALAAARESGFEPPKINGKPATETYRLVYTFAL